ncbi:MAG: hypothetical protein H6625_10525 [Bdellovibrionaceae bacterium]|nr:hypothetical protein [Pseudobdellovibrionaceae bacterium]
MQKTIDIESLGFDEGAHVIIKHALKSVKVDQSLKIQASSKAIGTQLQSWCRDQGHDFKTISHSSGVFQITKKEIAEARWKKAERAGATHNQKDGAVKESPKTHWGLAARGAIVESGTPDFFFGLNHKSQLWADNLLEMYNQAVQWVQ